MSDRASSSDRSDSRGETGSPEGMPSSSPVDRSSDAGPAAHSGTQASTGTPLGLRLRDLALAVSLANLCLLNAWFPALYDADYGYFNRLPVTAKTLLALATNFAWLTALFWASGQVVRRTRNRWVKLLGHLAIWAGLLLAFDFIRFEILRIPDHHVAKFVKHPLGAMVTVALGLAVLRWHRQAARLGMVLVLIVSPLALHTLGRIVLLLTHVQSLAQSSTPPPAPPPLVQPASPKRVVWLIFDEWDQRVAFAERPAGLRLPELDRLRSESFCAANAFPPGGSTLISMSALTTGLSVTAAVPTNSSELSLTVDGRSDALGWSQQTNVFGRARRLGFNTALVGWYHPYARIFGTNLNFCEWLPYPKYEPARTPTFAGTLVRQLRAAIAPLNLRQLQVDLCRETQRHALTLVTNASYGLVHLHFPVPHKPGIFLPDPDRYTITGIPLPRGYFNNLVLVDRLWGQLRRAMEESGTWNNTWVILSSDHWWRESTVYDGRIDRRVPFMVKAPGAGQHIDYPTPFDTILTAELVAAVLTGEIERGDQLATWFAQHHRPPREDLRPQTSTGHD